MPGGNPMLLALVLLPALAAPQPARWSHIRSTNSRIRAAIEEGYARSKTFRSLVDQLEGSNVILHIERGDCTCYYARACLGFVSSSGRVPLPTHRSAGSDDAASCRAISTAAACSAGLRCPTERRPQLTPIS